VLVRFKDIMKQVQATRPKETPPQATPGGPGTPAPTKAESTDEWAKRVGDFRRYQAGAELGSGARGTARLMTDPNDSKAPPLVVKQGADAEEIYKEADNYKKLGDHPNIAKCFGVREVDGKKGIVMEAVQGKSASGLADNLRARVAKGELSEEEYWSTVQYTMSKMLEGLAHMHKAGFVHNDIKPDNVMVDKNTGEVKLIDMGGVEEVGTAYDDKKSEFTGGYVAPERSKQATPQTDAFSAGASAYEMGEGARFDYKDKKKAESADFNYQWAKLAQLFKDPAEAMTKADDDNPLTRSVDARGRDVDPDDPGAKSKIKEAGRYAGKTAYVDFVNALMHPDPDKRLSPEEALQHPFLRDRILDDDKVKAVMLKALAPSDTPVQGKEPGRERLDKLTNLVQLGNNFRLATDYRNAAEGLDVTAIPPTGLLDQRNDLINRMNESRSILRTNQEPTLLLQRIIDAAVVTDNERHLQDLQMMDLLRKIAQTFTHASSRQQARLDEIDARIANGDLMKDGMPVVPLNPAEVTKRTQALAERSKTLGRLKGDVINRPSPELSQFLENLDRLRNEVLAMKRQAASEKTLMQSLQGAMQGARGLSVQRGRALSAVATLIAAVDTHDTAIDTALQDIDKKIAEVKGTVAKIAGDLKRLHGGIDSQVIKITAHFQRELAIAAAYDKAVKQPRNTAAGAAAFELARKEFDDATKAQKADQVTLRSVTERVIAQLTSYKTTLGQKPLGDHPALMGEIEKEIGRLKVEPRLFQ
jgi:serine/threonine protein kinase